MTEEQMHARHLVELGFLQDVMGELGHSSRVANRSAMIPYHTLLVDLGADSHGRSRQLALNFYPIDDEEFADSLFLQYFIVFPFSIRAEAVAAIARVLPVVNSKVVLGHFGINEDGDQLHFRYVQSLPSDEVMSTEKVADVVTLVSYTPQLFQDVLEDVATGKLPLKAAINKIASIYSQPAS